MPEFYVMTDDSSPMSPMTQNDAVPAVGRCRMLEQKTRALPTKRGVRRIGQFLCITAAILVLFCQAAVAQKLSMPRAADAPDHQLSVESICSRQDQDSAKAALQLVCQKGPLASERSLSSQTIVIGFLGGFASPHDLKHPEVLFAAFLRAHYGYPLRAEVFSNHDRTQALRYVLERLDINGDGILSEEERKSARIIIYGHSWGASETVAFARTLGTYHIPVLLTVQLDTVGKWGQHASRIPSNVQSAINFYQSEGLLRGGPAIVPADNTQTEIIGNFRYTYVREPINCSNYPWLARTFNKPHHEIENDPKVWNHIASLIDSRIVNDGGTNLVSANIGTIAGESASQGTDQNLPTSHAIKVNR